MLVGQSRLGIPRLSLLVLTIIIALPCAQAASKVSELARKCYSGSPTASSKACGKLVEIAESAKKSPVDRMAAIEALPFFDWNVLRRIAQTDSDSEIRSAATSRLNVLAAEATVDDVSHLTNGYGYYDSEPMLAKIAVGNKDASIRRGAVARLINPPPSLLEKLLQDPDANVRIEAVSDLTMVQEKIWDDDGLVIFSRPSDFSLLEKFLQDPDANVRIKAVRKLTRDPPEFLFGWRAAHAPSYQRVDSLLERLAVEDKDASVRIEAVRVLPYYGDDTLLKRIAVNDSDASVRSAAKNAPHQYSEYVHARTQGYQRRMEDAIQAGCPATSPAHGTSVIHKPNGETITCVY